MSGTPKSRRASARNEVRAEFVRAWLAESANAEGNYLGIPLCEIKWGRNCQGRAIEAHEPLMRSRGGDILDRANVFLTCRRCHDYVHAYPAEATRRGFLRSQWETTP